MFIQFSKQQKEQLIGEIQEFFLKERSEELGNLESEAILEFFKSKLGPYYFNEGIKHSRKVAEEKMAQLEEELYSLERPIR
ncbi:DUF2164 domain-containing protein [Neobacillus notoginsengisoli]|uniref:DUF2164 domain-containing protein n=1 Tax=Neobacillus notoginsengisoli TaxID=1578198 RepID=A0A417YXA5_9BACI|nr:DUF2164 domain-containing protein [Neobacillus notoginsengisoli]RHW42062.1 DUF2164 domain-containing protein [Neobacillus notoginsengisoli]